MMPTCPNCGSYISPGTNVCSCGTTFGGSSEEIKERNQQNLKSSRKKKGKFVRAIRKRQKI